MTERFDAVRHDLDYALRQIRRTPLLAGAVVATFALGIGANATMFGMVDRLLLRPPAHVAAPEELQRVGMRLHFGNEEYTSTGFSYPVYVDVRDRVPGFASAAMHTYPNPLSLGVGADARKVDGVLVSGTYFGTLGVRLVLGRPILPDDDVPPDGSPVVVIGHGLWQREFGGERSVIGKPIALGKRSFTVIGVAPTGFVGTGSRPVDVWIPVTAAEGIRFAGPNWANDRTSTWLSIIARLQRDVTPAAVIPQLTAAYRTGEIAGRGKVDSLAVAQLVSVLPSRQGELSNERRVTILLGAVSVLVLLIACANVANLLLVRALARRREIAVRLALGISRPRLVRQLVTEALMLAVVGGIAALAVVHWGSGLVQHLLMSGFAWPDAPIDTRVLGFTAAATVIVGIVTGLIPALQGSDPELARTLKEGSRGSGLARSRTRTSLLLLQAALSAVLLVGTGLFVRSLRNLHDVDLGVDLDRLLVGTVDLRSVGIDSSAADEYFVQAQAMVARLPGVASAALADGSPFGDWSLGTSVSVPGRDSLPPHENEESPYQHFVSPNYFATVGTAIVRGRPFLDRDSHPGAAPVAIVNEAMARWLWPSEDALGRCMRVGDLKNPKLPCSEIVGIAGNTHRGNIVGDRNVLQVYLPLGPSHSRPRARMLIVRPSSGEPGALVEPMRRVMQTAAAGIPFANVRPMSAALDDQLRPWELGATVFAAFGIIALVLSSLGLYSVVAYTVAHRMHEMGVRVALGAQRRDIRRLVLAQGLRVAAVGTAGGTIIALAAGRYVEPLLFEVSPRDPMVFGLVVAVLLAVATIASLGPARRATRADPLVALRSE